MSLLLLMFSIVFMVFIVSLFRNQQRRSEQNMRILSLQRSPVSIEEARTTKFNAVAGVDEAKQELAEVVEFLRQPRKFHSLGARIPRGVLLIGPPGTGKTLLARAVAGEACVPFYSVSGSEFVEIFVGVGASRVRDLFAKAKANAPAIIFIDEMDALGRQRGGAGQSQREEHDQTLNQILVEMDGFDSSAEVIVIAATNRPDTLDPALIRPGRFDRQVIVDVPDQQGRLDILRVHRCGKRFDETADLDALARQTAGFTGADLANLLNEAAIAAVRHRKEAIGAPELEEALDRTVGGPERRSKVLGASDRGRLAYHEVGHALVAHLLPEIEPVHSMTIVPRSWGTDCRHLIARDDRRLRSQAQLEAELVFLLAGIEAERLALGEVSTRSAGDLRNATDLARRMVTGFGMNQQLGPVHLNKDSAFVHLPGGIAGGPAHSEALAHEIDVEVQAVIAKASTAASTLLAEHRSDLTVLAQRLAVEEKLSTQEVGPLLDSQLPVQQAAIAMTPAQSLEVTSDSGR